MGFNLVKLMRQSMSATPPAPCSIPSFVVLNPTMISRSHALVLLSLCDGEEIWSVDYCRKQRVPESWITELTDAYESGFETDRETIYDADKPVNQYEGVLAVDLAIKLAKTLGLPMARILGAARDRSAIVREIREALEEG
jgi:hypothetical protein